MKTKTKFCGLSKLMMSLVIVGAVLPSCEKSEEDEGIGNSPVPHLCYLLLGKVTDKENNPIEGIEVSFGDGYYRDTTDKTGDYIVNYPKVDSYSEFWHVKFKDIKNNMFIEKDDSVKFEKYIGAHGLFNNYMGIATLNIQLNKELDKTL